jgi:hypothetical protein
MKQNCKTSCCSSAGGQTGGGAEPAPYSGPGKRAEIPKFVASGVSGAGPGGCITIPDCYDKAKVTDENQKACCNAILFAKDNPQGIKGDSNRTAKWFPGLTPESPIEQIQLYFYAQRKRYKPDENGDKCPKPCAFKKVSPSTIPQDDSGKGGCPQRKKFPPPPPAGNPLVYNGISWPDLCYSDEREEHVFLVGDWGGIDDFNLSPCDAEDPTCSIQMPYTAPNGACTPFQQQTLPQCKTPKRDFVPGVDDRAGILVADAFRKRAAQKRPRYVLNGGDNFYYSGVKGVCGEMNANDALDSFSRPGLATSTQFTDVFEALYYGDGVDGIPWLFCLGNHDYGGYQFNTAWDMQIYYTWAPYGRWILPAQYWHQHVSYPNKDITIDYYMLDTNYHDTTDPSEDANHNICSAVHNEKSNCGHVGGPRDAQDCVAWFKKLFDAQLIWLEGKLQQSTADWQIILTHFPPDNFNRYGKEVNDAWKRMVSNYGVDFFIGSHRHRQELHPGSYNIGIPCAVIGGGGGATSENVPGPETDMEDKTWRQNNPKGTRGAQHMAYPSPPGYQYGFMDMIVTKDKLSIVNINYNGNEMATMDVPKRLKKGEGSCVDFKCDRYRAWLSCQCSDGCEEYGNCCTDKATVCTPA